MHTTNNLSFKLAHTGFHRLIRSASLASAVSALALVTTDLGSDLSSSEQAVEAVDGSQREGPGSGRLGSVQTGSSCSAAFDPARRYPLLPEIEGADVTGESGVVMHLQHHRGVVELDDCLYELDRPLEIDFDGLDAVSMLLEIHGTATGSELFVSSAFAVETYTIEGPFFAFTMGPETSTGFELAAPGQSAPTVPVVVAKPVDDGPPPQ